jgi:hypothetical protein
MNLEEALTAFCKDTIAAPNDWYAWRKINTRFLPAGIAIGDGNAYSQNERLKLELSEKYHSAGDDEKVELTRYYIAVWGGVRRNRAEKLRSYALDDPGSLTANGCKGVASWSKALCIRDPLRFAIYDARVAVALNSLQALREVSDPRAFPLLVGQNRAINAGSQRLAFHAHEADWPELPEDAFYAAYNDLLSRVASALDIRHYAIEMALFAKAPALLRAAFPEEAL